MYKLSYDKGISALYRDIKGRLIMKKYKIIIGDDVFECDGYFHYNTCIE